MSSTHTGLGHTTTGPLPARDRAALAAPFLFALALVPFRTGLSHTNAAPGPRWTRRDRRARADPRARAEADRC
ncbi:hypothetical protein [Streptomyces sp. NPDC058457]|uniref:hypothetical protein n=1 Tax=Streptomyces sp. NPDC058457 TaxID=3346507 RepID=UPI00365986F4